MGHWPLPTGGRNLFGTATTTWPQYYLHLLGFILAITVALRQMAHWGIYGQVLRAVTTITVRRRFHSIALSAWAGLWALIKNSFSPEGTIGEA